MPLLGERNSCSIINNSYYINDSLSATYLATAATLHNVIFLVGSLAERHPYSDSMEKRRHYIHRFKSMTAVITAIW